MGLIVPALDYSGAEIQKHDIIQSMKDGRKARVTRRYWSRRHKQAGIEFRYIGHNMPLSISGTTATHEWLVIGQAYNEQENT